ncbi:helix-turn-helix domain-containing protein [Shinella zoogloeoides]|uniref:helix-turn-helix domain-containing protein n=1 Tax=Shinella TaxID=323620 RepID=UPI0028B19F2C|nr:helix-turn-helix domain-containing protein [Shinella zoogloeoides]
MAVQEPPTVPAPVACRIVRQLVLEMTALAGDRPLWRRDSRRTTCHVRQIAMYVCHVVLRLSLSEIGMAFGRDRTTVGHACNVVEDRRDDAAFDAFVSAIERVVLSVFGPAGIGSHE